VVANIATTFRAKRERLGRERAAALVFRWLGTTVSCISGLRLAEGPALLNGRSSSSAHYVFGELANKNDGGNPMLPHCYVAQRLHPLSAFTTAILIALSPIHAAAAGDDCGRLPDRLQLGGEYPFQGFSMLYESAVQITKNDSPTKQFLYCVENHNPSYHLEFQWGDQVDPTKYCSGMVKVNKASGCLTSSSNEKDVKPKELQFRRLRLGEWKVLSPDTIIPKAAMAHPPAGIVSAARYAQAEQFGSGQSRTQSRFRQFFDSPRSAQLLEADGTVNLDALLNDEKLLQEYITQVGPLRLENRIRVALPARRLLQKLDSDFRPEPDALFMVNISLISSLEKVPATDLPFLALTQLRYELDADEERLRPALSEYPRSVQVIAPDVSRWLESVVNLGRLPPNALVKLDAPFGRRFRVMQGQLVVSDTSERVSDASSPSVQASMAVRFFYPQ
jgi:hypothetical protein